MKPSQILRKAAWRIERGLSCGGCDAITNSSNDFLHRAMAREYFSVVGPNVAGDDWFWFGDFRPENQNRRVVALCLAAAIAESEGD